MKKSTFGKQYPALKRQGLRSLRLIATAAMILTPVAAFAQDSQSNLQINRSHGAAAGLGNVVNQTTSQSSYQDQFDYDGYYSEPSVQNSIQDNASNGSALGVGNYVDQSTTQHSGQFNTDIESYGHYYGY